MYSACAMNDEGQFVIMDCDVARIFYKTDSDNLNSLMSRMDTVESTKTPISTFTSLANRVTALETWRGNKDPAISKISTTPTMAAGVSVVGVSVALAPQSNVTNLMTAYSELKDKLNTVIGTLGNREIIAV